jgi:hypothetical protein
MKFSDQEIDALLASVEAAMSQADKLAKSMPMKKEGEDEVAAEAPAPEMAADASADAAPEVAPEAPADDAAPEAAPAEMPQQLNAEKMIELFGKKVILENKADFNFILKAAKEYEKELKEKNIKSILII